MGNEVMREHIRNLRPAVAAALVVALVCASATLAEARGPAAATIAEAACESPSIGFMGPLTGSAAFIGKEQLGFARYAIRRLGGGQVRLFEADTQLDPRQAARVASRLHADRKILAVVGPAASREVLAVAPIFKRGNRLAFISGSALSVRLTNGSIPNFFRVVPNESVQSPTVARYVRTVLKAKLVVLVDDGTAYSTRLADGVGARLRAGGVKVRRAAVEESATDFSATSSSVPAGTDVVFLPWRAAARAQIFAAQLQAQGNRAIIFGSDSLDSEDFTSAGAYVSSFAPDIRGIESNAEFIRGYRGRFVSNFGPPVYVAVQAALLAIRRACADGNATRAEVQRSLKQTLLRKTVLGRELRFTARGDARGSTFSIFKLGTGGKKTLVAWSR